MIDEQEIEKLWQAFKVLDVDGNGAISTEELGEVMRSLGQNPTEAGLRDLIKEIDVDLSGSIDFEEFKTLMIAKVGDRQSCWRHLVSPQPQISKPTPYPTKRLWMNGISLQKTQENLSATERMLQKIFSIALPNRNHLNIRMLYTSSLKVS